MNRRLRDPYERWCERRTPVGNRPGAAYSIMRLHQVYTRLINNYNSNPSLKEKLKPPYSEPTLVVIIVLSFCPNPVSLRQLDSLMDFNFKSRDTIYPTY